MLILGPAPGSFNPATELHIAPAFPPRIRHAGLTGACLRRVVGFIDARLHEPLPLTSLAAEARLSAFHFARAFKRTTGLSPHQFVLLRRIERARELLLRPEARIADVATRVGFCDQSHLSGHFKRVHGVPPREFVRREAVGR